MNFTLWFHTILLLTQEEHLATCAGLSTMKSRVRDQLANIAGEVCLQNSSVAISFLPGAGGNISVITDLQTGRNWLWQNPHLPITNNRSGENYGQSLDSGGWDEILLSIATSEIEATNSTRVEIADHGDLVRQSWTAEIQSDTNGNQRCRMTAGGATLNYDFVRMVRLQSDAPIITFDYSLTNNEAFEWPFYWCPHALLDAQSGMTIELPPDLPFHLDGAEVPAIERWPRLPVEGRPSLDLSNSFAADGEVFAHKVFARSPSDGTVSVVAPGTNERLTMTFDPDVLPWLGLWINNRGWSGCGSEPHQNLGLEPSTTNYDCVAEAVRNDAIDWIQPGETRAWTLTVELTA